MEVDQDIPQNASEIVPTSGDTPISPREAANALSQYRWKRDAGEERDAQTDSGEQPVEAATTPEEPAVIEATETSEPAEVPPIEPPRSWTKEEKDEFLTYPREAQEKIARREQDRETALRRGQNETAEQRKAVEAERLQLEQTRKEYENTLPVLLQTLQQQQQGEFSDIKTMSDVEKLAREDWPRYALWDAKQKQIANVQQEIKVNQERQQQEFHAQWTKFAKDEDAKFIERAPEMADKDKAAKISTASIELLKELGFTDQDLSKLWGGEASVSLRDHRLQLLIRDAVRYREAKAAVPKAAVKTVPQVQRPGVAAPRNADDNNTTATLSKQLDGDGSYKTAARLLIARREAARR